MNSVIDDFSERLKELRKDKNLSLSDLAKEIGVSDIAISRWERKLRMPNIETLAKLAVFFGVSSDYLLGLED
jgi:transcriptional regulator with XRE-family HTH domain